MFQAEISGFYNRSRRAFGAIFMASLAVALLMGAALPARAQEKLTPVQQETIVQCLVTCKKGDAQCQNSCTNKASTPAYFKAAGSCVRACANALSGPGQQNADSAGDLQKCVQACTR